MRGERKTAVFGKTSVGIQTAELYTGYVYACKYSGFPGGVITSVSVYINSVAASANVKVRIYNGSGNKVAESPVLSINSTPQWRSFTLNASLPAGDIFIAFTCSSTWNQQYDDYSDPKTLYVEATYPNFPETIDPSNLQLWEDYSAYVTYTPTPTPLSVTVSPTSASLQTGQSQTFTASVSGGTPPYTVTWIDRANGNILGTGTSITLTFSIPGNYAIYANVMDSAGETLDSIDVPITVSTAPPPPTETVISYCESPDGSGDPVGGPWVAGTGTGISTYTTSTDRVQGSNSLRAVPNFADPSVLGYAMYVYKYGAGQPWGNMAGKEVYVPRLKTNHPEVPIDVFVVTDNWANYINLQRQVSIPNTGWNECPVDLRLGVGLIPNLGAVDTVVMVVGGFTQTEPLPSDYYLLIDYVTARPGGAIALQASITPAGGVITLGESFILMANVLGGTPPYSYRWYVDGLDTAYISNPYSFYGSIAGTHTVSCRITDAAEASVQPSVSVTVTQPPPTGPCRPLHVEGSDIKDDLGNLVYLRGVNRPSGYTASCTGNWGEDGQGMWGAGYTTFTDKGVSDRIKQMRNLGINCVRLIFLADWYKNDSKTNLSGQTTNVGCKYAMRRAAEIAQTNGMYLILAPWGIAATQVGMPVGTSLFPTNQAFADWWKSVAQDFIGLSNVIFELWNEPVDGQTAWFTAAKLAAQVIRSVSNNLIVVQYDYCASYGWVPSEHASWGASVGGVVYSNHIYRGGAATFIDTDLIDYPNGIRSTLFSKWQYDAVIDSATNKAKYPLIIGEVGARTGVDETWFENLLRTLNDWGCSFTAWQWDHPDMLYPLQQSATAFPFPVNTAGTILVNAIPPIPPPLQMGYVQVYAFSDSTEVVADGVVVETGRTFQTRALIDLLPGTYTLRVSYSGQQQEKTVTVEADKTVRIDFQFTEVPTPRPPTIFDMLWSIFEEFSKRLGLPVPPKPPSPPSPI